MNKPLASPHPDNLLLQTYLDGELPSDQSSAVRLHLATCPDCAARLERLRSLFNLLGDLPDAPLEHDLAASVLTRLAAAAPAPARQPAATAPVGRWFTPLLAAQLALAGLLLALAYPWLAALTAPYAAQFSLETLQADLVQAALDTLARVQMFWTTFAASLPDLRLQFDQALAALLAQFTLAQPAQLLPLSAPLLTLLLGAAFLLWLAGNSLLLRPRR